MQSCLFLIFCSVASVVVSAEAHAQAQVEPITFTVRFLQAPYPEMANMHWRYAVEADGALGAIPKDLLLNMQIYRGSSPVVVRDDADRERTDAYAAVKYGPEGGWNYVYVFGRVVNQAENERFAAIATLRRDWTPERVKTELKRLGAKFVDGASSVPNLVPVEKWKDLIGELRLREHRLSLPVEGERIPDGRTDFSIYWELLYALTGHESQLYVRVEPFGGRVIWVAQVHSAFHLK